MYRGTTPTLYLELETELDISGVTEIWVTFKSPTVEITKTLSNGELFFDSEEKKITVSLSQEDTLQMYQGFIEIQVRLRVGEGNNALAYTTNIEKVEVDRILKGGVI